MPEKESPSQKGKKLRDAVHKDIHLTAQEIEIVDTPTMQRLRGIHQLGAAFLVYPSAQHTRFEHSIGACWMAKQLLGHIEKQLAEPIAQTLKKTAALAGLVHDVTHIPFGHTFEDERKILSRHDKSAKRFDHFLLKSELGHRLATTEAGRRALRILDPSGELPPDQQWLQDIVSGTICADLLDYLKRDNYFCGLSRQYDQRVFHYFTIQDGRLMLKLHHQGIFRYDALSEVTNLLRIRYVLSERVYYHHAKIACGVMISKAIERAFANGMDESELYSLTDEGMIFYLLDRYGRDPGLRNLLEAFQARDLFKRCYMLSDKIDAEELKELVAKYHLNEADARGQAEQQIAERLGGSKYQVGIYCAPQEMALKEANVPVVSAPGKTERFSDLNSAEIQLLQDQHRALWKFYVFISPNLPVTFEKAGHICEDVIGLPNRLPQQLQDGGV
ncbi:MAG: HD domain-containing protein [Candidatus Brocadiia bacterium]